MRKALDDPLDPGFLLHGRQIMTVLSFQVVPNRLNDLKSRGDGIC